MLRSEQTLLIPRDPIQHPPKLGESVMIKAGNDFYIAKYFYDKIKTLTEGKKVERYEKTACFHTGERLIHFHQFEDVVWFEKLKFGEICNSCKNTKLIS